MNKTLAMAVSLAASFALAACGSSTSARSTSKNPALTATATAKTPTSPAPSGSTAFADVKAAIKAKLQAGNSSGTNSSFFTMNDAQASCAANAIVNALGVSKIRTYQLVTADDKANSESLGQARLSTDDATKVVDGIFTCVGGSTIARLMTHRLQTSMPSTVTPRVRTCMERKVTPAALREFAITQLSGGNVETSSFMLSLQKCAA